MPKCSRKCRSSTIRFKCCRVSRVVFNFRHPSNTPILNMHSSSNSHIHNANSSSSCSCRCIIHRKRALHPRALLKCKCRISAEAAGSLRRARTLAQQEPTVEPTRTGGAQECHRVALCHQQLLCPTTRLQLLCHITLRTILRTKRHMGARRDQGRCSNSSSIQCLLHQITTASPALTLADSR